MTIENEFIENQPIGAASPEGIDVEQNKLPLLPLKNVVILPKSIIPIIVGRKSSIKAVEESLKINKKIFISSQKDPDIEDPQVDDIFKYGTKAVILQVMKMPNNALKILAEGTSRAKIQTISKDKDFFEVEIEELKTTSLTRSVKNEAAWRQVANLYQTYTSLNEKAPIELVNDVRSAEDMDYLTDTIAVHLNLTFDERQEVLEIVNLTDRMVRLSELLKKEIEILEAEKAIKGRVQSQVEKNQKEYYLNEQIKAIQKELGREDNVEEAEKIREKMKTLGLSAEAKEKVEKELKRLEQLPPMSSEAAISKNYIDWVISLPWSNSSKDNVNFKKAEKLLEKSHFGLKKAKERIMEFLAAQKYTGNSEKAPIICLIGPPGVGKTSLSSAIAECMNREFVRISLGGVRDEAEIRGHRRTYIGALPGKIIQAMRKAKTTNPVILLDEIDKVSKDINGDPASALLEVLDPEQNKGFTDHFLDLEYDLSKVMFLTTANYYDTIPYPLLDRMEIISLAGYSDREKIAIANNFLIPKKLKEFNLKKTQFKITDKELEVIINEYTKEAGVRQLERVLAKLMRKTIQNILQDKKSTTVTNKLLVEWLGYPKYKKSPLGEDQIGLSTGLAWTELGGEVLEIETTIVPGKGNLNITGQIGEVMQESVQASVTYIRSKSKDLGIRASFNTTRDIHIHMPEGATPKDGPSAGIAITTALVSALTGNPVRKEVAMTGEISLRGRVLAIGGLKEKLLAAKRYEKSKVIVPKENEDDVKEILKDFDQQLNLDIVFVEKMDEVLEHALELKPFKRSKVKKTKARK